MISRGCCAIFACKMEIIVGMIVHLAKILFFFACSIVDDQKIIFRKTKTKFVSTCMRLGWYRSTVTMAK